MRSARAAGFILILLALLSGCASAPPPAMAGVQTRVAPLSAGKVEYELYLPSGGDRPAPLVIVAHGFSRDRFNMRGWAEHFATEGFVVALPSAPSWGDHLKNRDAVEQLLAHLKSDKDVAPRIDASRIGMVGFSHGGLWTFLAAGEIGGVSVWVGLDPVDRHDRAVAAARNVRCRILSLLAEPSRCNVKGNWTAVRYAEGVPSLTLVVNGASHADCEAPTDGFARWACGPTDPARHRTFVEYTTAALRAELLKDAESERFLASADADPRVRRPAAVHP